MCIFHMNEHKILVCMYLCVDNEMCVQILKVNSVKPAIQIFDWFCRDIRWKLRNGNTEAKGNGSTFVSFLSWVLGGAEHLSNR